MKLLLDTHILLWAIGKTDALSELVKREIKKTDNQILVSAVSLWEIALKHSLGKLTVDFDIQKIPEYCKRMEFELIQLNPVEALQSSCLPQKTNHRDPFDRMLIYQCITNGYTLASRDNRIEQYKKDGLEFIR
ncbi:MAG: type II toxin-antitoxin system VapC family toxin [Treponema sp.]|jgi:PIN domain nuclease of toxin-antitoxin system|nr:type II toxin-antitoxin system VapC family toxin [Treponema sp.]